MFVCQLFADKKKREEDEEHSDGERRFGMKIRSLAKFLEAHLEGREMPLEAAEVASAVRQAEKYFEKNNLDEFMSTLTPGAQDIIKAGSFLWGYENAAKYLKNAMKMADEKNIGSIEDRSREVLQSVQEQALGENEHVRESEKIIWTYYNESLKDFQSQSSKTEIMVDKSLIEKELQNVPLTAKEAVAASIEEKSAYPALLYCTSMKEIEAELEQQQSNAIGERKKEEVARLVGPQETPVAEKPQSAVAQKQEIKVAEKEPRTVTPDIAQSSEKKGKPPEVSEPALAVALHHQDEITVEYERTIRAIQKVLSQLELIQEGDSARLKMLLETNLPPQLSQSLLRKKDFQSRIALQKQLKKWVAFCRKGKGEISNLPPGRIAKLLSLSSLLKK